MTPIPRHHVQVAGGRVGHAAHSAEGKTYRKTGQIKERTPMTSGPVELRRRAKEPPGYNPQGFRAQDTPTTPVTGSGIVGQNTRYTGGKGPQ
jgi:hypothetical protein